MPLWIVALLLITCVVAIFTMPSKGIFRTVKIVLSVLVGAALLYIAATLIFIGGID